jgi:hypothetical protein
MKKKSSCINQILQAIAFLIGTLLLLIYEKEKKKTIINNRMKNRKKGEGNHVAFT